MSICKVGHSSMVQPYHRWISGLSPRKGLLLGTIVVFNFFLGAAAQERTVEEFFETFKLKRDGIGFLQAEFIQKNHLPQEIITTEGVLLYSKPRTILFKMGDPERVILVCNEKGYEYDAEIKQLTIFDIDNNPQAAIFYLGFDDDISALKNAYTITLFDSSDERGHTGIKIIPREDSEHTAYFLEANLFLRDEDYLPYRIHIVNDHESQLYIEVTSINKEKKPDATKTRIRVPQGVKIIENDTVIGTVEEGEIHYPIDSVSSKLIEKVLSE